MDDAPHPSSTPPRRVSLPQVPADGAAERPHSRMGRRRAAVLILLHLAMAAHIAHWKLAGSTLTPVEPSEAMKTLEEGTINAGFVFFAAALLLTLVFGRFICGWACHIVALQDFCGWMMKKIGIRPVPFRSRLLVFAPLILALYMFVWPTVYRMFWTEHPAPTLVRAFSTTDFWDTFAGIAIAIPFLLVCGFATVYFLGAKGFCTYGCPYGGFFYPVDRLSPGKIIMDPDRCDGNGHCTAVCTSNVRVHEEIQQYGMVVDPGCMKCMDCVSACPTNALSYGFAAPSLMKKAARPKRPRHKRVYDLSWPEEIALAIIFLATFFATRNLYGLVPLLMAMGLAGCSTFILWKAWRALRVPNVRLHKWQLRYKGELRPIGTAYLTLSALLALVIAHSLLIGVITRIALHDAARYPLDRQALLVGTHPPLTDEHRAALQRAINRYELTAPIWRGGIGLAPNAGSDNTAAILYLALDRPDDALAALERIVNAIGPKSGMKGQALLDVARIQMLRARTESSQAHADAALATLERARLISPNDPEIIENYAAALFQMRRDLDGAIAQMRRALELDRTHVERWMRLAPLLLMKGDVEGAMEALDQAVEHASDRSIIVNRGRSLLTQMGFGATAEEWPIQEPQDAGQ